MKKSDLYREYARVIDMCEGTQVNPLDCVKHNGELLTHWNVTFGYAVEHYTDTTFALAIVEDKPVFEGDKLWRRGKEVIVKYTPADRIEDVMKYLYYQDKHNYVNDCIEQFTWTPPKPATVTVTILREDAEDFVNGVWTSLSDMHKSIKESIKEALK